MKNLAIIANILSSISLLLFLFIYHIIICKYLPIFWSLTAIALSLNFARNRLSLYRICIRFKHCILLLFCCPLFVKCYLFLKLLKLKNEVVFEEKECTPPVLAIVEKKDIAAVVIDNHKDFPLSFIDTNMLSTPNTTTFGHLTRSASSPDENYYSNDDDDEKYSLNVNSKAMNFYYKYKKHEMQQRNYASNKPMLETKISSTHLPVIKRKYLYKKKKESDGGSSSVGCSPMIDGGRSGIFMEDTPASVIQENIYTFKDHKHLPHISFSNTPRTSSTFIDISLDLELKTESLPHKMQDGASPTNSMTDNLLPTCANVMVKSQSQTADKTDKLLERDQKERKNAGIKKIRIFPINVKTIEKSNINVMIGASSAVISRNSMNNIIIPSVRAASSASVTSSPMANPRHSHTFAINRCFFIDQSLLSMPFGVISAEVVTKKVVNKQKKFKDMDEQKTALHDIILCRSLPITFIDNNVEELELSEEYSHKLSSCRETPNSTVNILPGIMEEKYSSPFDNIINDGSVGNDCMGECMFIDEENEDGDDDGLVFNDVYIGNDLENEITEDVSTDSVY